MQCPPQGLRFPHPSDIPVARCPFLATSIRTATKLLETSQRLHSPPAKVNSSTIAARIR